ncbi:four helix bundle protein [Frigoriflavimonas asaccharolytica]|uniref:Four helix bundle protein n=1 Tax=Frigoriflavimonas asaccharolytica TaxID=2735899 RepID=A0A8J8G8U8_9FLAO|nr:four helix bundle protein [Frigoriflavimonas asaccharolytica]NRS91102.1 four helix bundle protein [Frigoriflavimonas asaccharolytica]
MATVTRFEDLEIWKLSRVLSKDICKIADRDIFKTDYKLKTQIKGAVGSIMDNIAEGFERDGNAEFKQFLSISKGSAGEVRSQIYRCFDNDFITEEEFIDLKLRCEILSVKIKNFMTYLQNRDFKGNKFK